MNPQEFLGRRGVEFKVLQHVPTYDAQHLADAIHESGYHVAKTVLLRVDNRDFVVALLPATHEVVLEKARQVLMVKKVEIATEEELAQRCPDCELGALPPFGSHYNMQTVVDKTLLDDEQIVFEGITHNEAVQMNYDDFVRLEEPLVGSFARLIPTRTVLPEERNP